MRRRLRRFAAIGTIVTAVDVVLLVVLRRGADLPVVVADALSIAVAACASYALHRAVTFGDDPYVRWAREPWTFAWVTVAAGALDVVVCRAGVAVLGGSLADLLWAKAAALAGAAFVRAGAYRDVLFRRVRAEQGRRADRPPPPGDVRLTVVVPAYREAGRIGDTVTRLRAAVGEAEVVVVDDGSEDGTAAAATAAGADQVLTHERNRGKGAAVRTGVLAGHGRTVAFTDADLSYPPEQLLRLVAEVEGGWDVVVGSRRHVDTTTLVRTRNRSRTMRAASRPTRTVDVSVWDTSTGTSVSDRW